MQLSHQQTSAPHWVQAASPSSGSHSIRDTRRQPLQRHSIIYGLKSCSFVQPIGAH